MRKTVVGIVCGVVVGVSGWICHDTVARAPGRRYNSVINSLAIAGFATNTPHQFSPINITDLGYAAMVGATLEGKTATLAQLLEPLKLRLEVKNGNELKKISVSPAQIAAALQQCVEEARKQDSYPRWWTGNGMVFQGNSFPGEVGLYHVLGTEPYHTYRWQFGPERTYRSFSSAGGRAITPGSEFDPVQALALYAILARTIDRVERKRPGQASRDSMGSTPELAHQPAACSLYSFLAAALLGQIDPTPKGIADNHFRRKLVIGFGGLAVGTVLVIAAFTAPVTAPAALTALGTLYVVTAAVSAAEDLRLIMEVQHWKRYHSSQTDAFLARTYPDIAEKYRAYAQRRQEAEERLPAESRGAARTAPGGREDHPSLSRSSSESTRGSTEAPQPVSPATVRREPGSAMPLPELRSGKVVELIREWNELTGWRMAGEEEAVRQTGERIARKWVETREAGALESFVGIQWLPAYGYPRQVQRDKAAHIYFTIRVTPGSRWDNPPGEHLGKVVYLRVTVELERAGWTLLELDDDLGDARVIKKLQEWIERARRDPGFRR